MSRIYLGRIPYNAREKDVERFFRGFGRIRDINLKNGFGFVEFDDPRDADDAVYELNGRELLGERVIVEHSRGSSSGYNSRRSGGFDRGDRGGYSNDRKRGYGPPTRTDYRIIVENISSRVSWQDLKDFMRSAGEITFADAHKQRVGEGVVEYASYDDMKSAMRKLNGVDLNGRKLKLYEDYRGSKRGRSRSRSRSRSRGRSRSRSRNRSRSRSRSKGRDHSRSRSGSRDRSRSPRGRSKSPHDRSKSRSKSRERSRSKSRSRSRSKSPVGDRNNGEDIAQVVDSSSPRRSRSHSMDRDQSRSPSPGKRSPNADAEERRSRSASPAPNEPDE